MDVYETKRILVVEDDLAMRQVVAEHISMAGFKPLEAEDGEQAIVVVASQKPHAIILDLMLPKVDGFGVLKNIRNNPDASISAIPVIVFSNLWSNKDILAAEALKIEAYFIKTQVTMADVMDRVRQIFNEKQLKDLNS